MLNQTVQVAPAGLKSNYPRCLVHLLIPISSMSRITMVETLWGSCPWILIISDNRYANLLQVWIEKDIFCPETIWWTVLIVWPLFELFWKALILLQSREIGFYVGEVNYLNLICLYSLIRQLFLDYLHHCRGNVRHIISICISMCNLLWLCIWQWCASPAILKSKSSPSLCGYLHQVKSSPSTL